MSLDLSEPNEVLVASVWAEVDNEYPSLDLSDPPTEEEIMAAVERDRLRASEFTSRYAVQRWTEIAADRATLSQDMQDEIVVWEAAYPVVRASGRYLLLGDLEAKWRAWATNAIVKRAPVVPASLTPRKFRLALLSVGVSPAQITSMLAGNEAGLTEWEFASSIERYHPLIATLGAALGKTDAEIDAIFIAGKDL